MKSRAALLALICMPVLILALCGLLALTNQVLAQKGVIHEYSVVFVYLGSNGPAFTPQTSNRSPVPCVGIRHLHFHKSLTPDIPYAIPLPWTCRGIRQVTILSGPPP